MTRLLATVFLLVACPLSASAHGIGVEARLKGDRVLIEAFFDDDTPAADAKVAVTDDSGRQLTDGRTDLKGTWSFAAPPAGKYRVTVDAGAGHLAKTTFTIPPKAGIPAASADSPEPEVIVSDGPTRATFTGPLKWVLAAIGLGLIAALAFVVRRLARNKPAHAAHEVTR